MKNMMEKRPQILCSELSRIDGCQPGSGEPKHHKMAISPFVFLRGAAQLFYRDLASGVLPLPDPSLALPFTTVMGDCHVSNFGFFTEEGSHGERVIFAINDFDDACIGRPEWDLLRFAVSVLLCVGHCQLMLQDDKSSGSIPVVDEEQCKKGLGAFFQGYIELCRSRLGSPSAEDFSLGGKELSHSPFMMKFYKKASKRALYGKHFLKKSALAKAVEFGEEGVRFKTLPERFTPLNAERYQQLCRHFAPYMDDKIQDVVLRIGGGTGSVNMERFYFLIGPDFDGREYRHGLYHIVEAKQQREAAALHFYPQLSPVNQLDPAHLTTVCQRKMQRMPDVVLDETYWEQAHWLIRSRHHARLGLDPQDMAMGEQAVEQGGFIDYLSACGTALALAHCRGDRRSMDFEQVVLRNLPVIKDDLIKSAQEYARLTESDWQRLRQILPT